jgi:NAD-dependent dihydropyrimidine dehydrogenase PreA subunit
MPGTITPLCIDCVDTGCVSVCPVDCIYEYTGNDREKFPNQALSILVIAAALEVGGDALIRIGLEGATYSMAAGALTLFAYGFVVNKSGLDF